MDGLGAYLRNVRTVRKALDELNPSICDPIREGHWEVLREPVTAVHLEAHSFDMFVFKEPVVNGIRNKKIARNTQDKDTLIRFCKDFEKPPLELPVSMIQDAEVVLVHLHRLAIDLFSLIEARMAVRAEGDEIFKGVVLRFGPWGYVSDLGCSRSASRNSASVAGFNEHSTLDVCRDSVAIHTRRLTRSTPAPRTWRPVL